MTELGIFMCGLNAISALAIHAAEATPRRSASKTTVGGVFIQRARLGLVAVADADGIDDDEVVLRARVFAGEGLHLRRREHAGAAPFHLLEINAAAHVHGHIPSRDFAGSKAMVWSAGVAV